MMDPSETATREIRPFNKWTRKDVLKYSQVRPGSDNLFLVRTDDDLGSTAAQIISFVNLTCIRGDIISISPETEMVRVDQLP